MFYLIMGKQLGPKDWVSSVLQQFVISEGMISHASDIVGANERRFAISSAGIEFALALNGVALSSF
jgi:hypothetical protein